MEQSHVQCVVSNLSYVVKNAFSSIRRDRMLEESSLYSLCNQDALILLMQYQRSLVLHLCV